MKEINLYHTKRNGILQGNLEKKVPKEVDVPEIITRVVNVLHPDKDEEKLGTIDACAYLKTKYNIEISEGDLIKIFRGTPTKKSLESARRLGMFDIMPSMLFLSDKRVEYEVTIKRGGKRKTGIPKFYYGSDEEIDPIEACDYLRSTHGVKISPRELTKILGYDLTIDVVNDGIKRGKINPAKFKR